MPRRFISYLNTGYNGDLATDVWYALDVRYVNPCPYTRSLQIIFALKSDSDNRERYLLQNYKIGSKEYVDFVTRVYGGDYGSIMKIDSVDFYRFFCKCKLKKENGDISIDWKNTDSDICPINDLFYLFDENY